MCDKASAASLAQRGVEGRLVQDGDAVDLGVPIGVYGREHAIIHPDLLNVPNVSYLVADRFFSAGDAFTAPDAAVEVLAVPVGARRMKLSEAVDYLRRMQPRLPWP